MATFANIYFIRNNAGTYEAYDSAGSLQFSGANLITNVLDAITAAHSSDFAILFGAGTFDLSTGTWAISGKNGFLVQGMGTATKLTKSGTGIGIHITGTDPSRIADIRVADLRLSGPSTEGTPVAGSGIFFDYANDSLIEGCEVTGFGSAADDSNVRVRHAVNFTIQKNRCFAGQNGILTGAATSTDFPEADRCRVVANACYDNFDDGIHTQQSARCTFEANQCWGNGESGIDVLGDDDDVITANLCYSNTAHGIELGNTTAVGTPDRGHTVSGNVCAGNGSDGILLNGTTDHCDISGNVSRGNGRYGVGILGTATRTAEKNNVVGNVCTGNVDGIRISNNCHRNTVQANVCRDNTGRGIYITNAGGTAPDANVIENNTALGNTTAQVATSGDTNTVRRDNIGGPGNSHQQVSGATTLAADDNRTVLNVDTSGGAVTVTLPDNAAASGRGFLVRRAGGNAVTVARAGADTIDGAAANKTLDTDKAAIGLFSVGGGDWKVVAVEGTVS